MGPACTAVFGGASTARVNPLSGAPAAAGLCLDGAPPRPPSWFRPFDFSVFTPDLKARTANLTRESCSPSLLRTRNLIILQSSDCRGQALSCRGVYNGATARIVTMICNPQSAVIGRRISPERTERTSDLRRSPMTNQCRWRLRSRVISG